MKVYKSFYKLTTNNFLNKNSFLTKNFHTTSKISGSYNTDKTTKSYDNNLSLKNKTNKFIIKISSKTLFTTGKTKKQIFEEYLKDPEDRKPEYFIPKDPIVFKDKKYPLLKVKSLQTTLFIMENLVFLPTMLFAFYRSIRSLLLFRPIRCIAWGAVGVLIMRYKYGIIQNKKFMISDMNLLEDGKTVEVKTYNNVVFNVDIFKIRRMTVDEALYFAQLIRNINTYYIPIVINKEFYIIEKTAAINDPELLNAVSQGQYISLDNENIIKKDTIDI
jgi:hypothetical protein